ncbi:MAG: AAA family ATPase, partial [Opitutales bacterium]
MITELNISNFKSLRDVKLKLGPLNLFIGANASGKSNFFDALRVLQGIGNGYTVSEVFNGRPEDPINSRWQGIRGGIGKALYSGCTNEDLKFGTKTSTPLVPDSCVSYSIEISTVEKLVRKELMELITGGKTISLFSISNNPRSMQG